MLDLERFRGTPLTLEPFEHVVVPRFIREEHWTALERDFPDIQNGGSFPLTELEYGPSFETLISLLHGPELKLAVSEKFSIDLEGRPSMLTVRGRARAKDGRIHTDSHTKIMTVLIYLNAAWSDDGGHLRLLSSSRSLEDYFADVAPVHATAVFFRCRDNAWHGHTPYIGVRRAMQLNWVTDASVVSREQGRHRLSAKLKTWFGRS